MRRKYFGVVVAAFATFGPALAWGGDREIAEQIIQRLNVNRDSGELKDFTLDMKVDQGVVLFRGNVVEEFQRDLVLKAAEGIEGVTEVVDEVSVTATTATVIKPKANVALEIAPEPVDTAEPAIDEEQAATPSPSESLAVQADVAAPIPGPEVMPGIIQRTAAVEPTGDAQVVSRVVSALQNAKQAGLLRGFGVDVKSTNGVLQLSGRASSPEQRDHIIRIAQNVPGVAGIREAITVPSASGNLPRLPQPPALQQAPVAQAPPPRALNNGVPAMAASGPVGMQATAAPYRMPGNGQLSAAPAAYGGSPVMGQPVPMAPVSAVGAPRYDSPNLPNYAWPGYAAYPNYAALTYPQQYSPSAWPYIGPFYPYPQVPLGWRKVSLEWDDGWWSLDFTDR